MTTITTKIFNIENPDDTMDIIYLSDRKCVHCATANQKLEMLGYFSKTSKLYNVYLIEYCATCSRLALCEYTVTVHNAQFICGKLQLSNYTPRRYPSATIQQYFSSDIHKLSPKFVKIYHQAEDAEHNGLDEICGMGYRKALEFLIKDYLCSIPKNKDHISTISSEFLSQSIQRINDSELKTLATACAWLGNDETHYTRRHTDYTLSDIKSFVRYAVAIIEKDIRYKNALNLIGQ